MTGKQSRQERKQARENKRKEKSVRLAAAFIESEPASTPKILFIPDTEKIPIIGPVIGSLEVPKQPSMNATGSRFGLQMTWCARHADRAGDWSWGESRCWTDQEWGQPLLSGMNNLEGLDWREIQNMSSDSGHLMHHDHDITQLCDDAVGRWLELKYDQFETIFRFRLGNTKRAWGIELHGHFYLIWYERYHNIYPVE